MFTVYINEFLRNGSVITTQERMFDIPGMYPEDEMIVDPRVKNELGKADTLEFSMEPSNPWYSSLLQMRTRFRVDYDGQTIFFGRVLSIDTDMYGKRMVHCEGALAFLIDTLMLPVKEEERQKISIGQYISDLIGSHNNLTESWKHFELGEVPGHYSNSILPEQRIVEPNLRKFGASSWTSILNCLEELTSKYGGYLRARHVNGTNYIDWLRNYYNPSINNQTLHIGDNIIDISNSIDVNGLFTALIPEGTKNGKPIYVDDPRPYTVSVPVRKKKKPDEEEPASAGGGS